MDIQTCKLIGSKKYTIFSFDFIVESETITATIFVGEEGKFDNWDFSVYLEPAEEEEIINYLDKNWKSLVGQ